MRAGWKFSENLIGEQGFFLHYLVKDIKDSKIVKVLNENSFSGSKARK
jgi:hypothetical protein